MRYAILTDRPAGTGERSEDELVAPSDRDAMVGIAKVAAPAWTAAPQASTLPDIDGPARRPVAVVLAER